MEDKILLNLVGVTYNQIESGVYAVILQEAGGQRRIPIVIGAAEAQAIECKLQAIKVPRPLTHDLMETVMAKFGIVLHYVWLHKLPTGVFAADLHLERDGMPVVVDSRSSDAIALAVRIGAPIYTSEELVREVGYEQQARRAQTQQRAVSALEAASMADLEKEMQKASETENYERAAEIKKEIERRKKG